MIYNPGHTWWAKGKRSSQHEELEKKSPFFPSPWWSDLLRLHGSLTRVAIWWDIAVLIFNSISHVHFFFFCIRNLQLILWLMGRGTPPKESAKVSRFFTESLLLPAHLSHLLLDVQSIRSFNMSLCDAYTLYVYISSYLLESPCILWTLSQLQYLKLAVQ